jgi:O-antigen/teichoic acid export membrane protein
MPRLAVAGVVGKLLTAALIFAFVRTSHDLAIAVGVQGVGVLASGVISLRLAIKAGVTRPQAISVKRAVGCIRDGWDMFLSTASVSLYSNLNVLAVTALAGPLQAGMFVGADKIRNAAQSVITPVSLVMYPRLSSMAANRDARMLPALKTLFLVQGGGMALLSVAIWAGAPLLVPLLLGPGYDDAIPVLRWLAPVPLLVSLSNLLGIQLMLPLGLRSDFLISIATPAVVSLTYMPLLAYLDGAAGVGASLTITETLVVVVGAALVYARRRRISLIINSGPTPEPAR